MLNQKGMATLELIPLLIMFVMLLNFTFGFFGVIHSGILNSIAARNYAFETFRNRTSLNYLRDEESAKVVTYLDRGFRFHSIVNDVAVDDKWIATQRPIKFTEVKNPTRAVATSNDHNNTIRNDLKNEDDPTSKVFTGETKDDDKSGVNPVWIMTSYGICLTYNCLPR